MKALKRVEAPPSSTKLSGYSPVIEFGNRVHGNYTINTARSSASTFSGSKPFETLEETLGSEARPQWEGKAMDIPKSEKTTASRSTQVRKHLPLTKSELLYSRHFVSVRQSRLGAASHNHSRTLFQQIQMNQPIAFQEKGYIQIF